jgi:8-hydroxy-5-deazaflavin:NADPH oxidoreductase
MLPRRLRRLANEATVHCWTTVSRCPYRGARSAAASGAATTSELIQHHIQGASVVKAFNTIFWQHLRDRGRPAGDPARLAVPLAGDDDEAKRTVASLIDQLGFDTVDTGTLADGGAALEPGTAPFGASLTADELRRSLHG